VSSERVTQLAILLLSADDITEIFWGLQHARYTHRTLFTLKWQQNNTLY